MPLTEDLVSRLESEIDGFNRRPLGLEDLERLCEAADVVLVFHPFPGQGILFRRHGRPVIAVNRRLSPGHAVFVGFHEYFHHRFHPGSVHTYMATPYWLDKIELQASILAALAVLPTPLLVEGLARGEPLAELCPAPRYILDFRLQVHRGYEDLLRQRKVV